MTINKKTKILIFRTDRIGDLVNTSSFLKSLKSYYVNSEITLVCSNYNRPIAESYKFIDKIIIYDKSFIFFDKIKIFTKLITSFYDIAMAFDGKNFSYLVSLFNRAKHKYAVCFKKQKNFFGQNFNIFRPSIILCKIFFDTYVICDEDYNKQNVNSDFNNHYLTMYYYLLKKNNIKLIPGKHIFIIDSDSEYIFNDFFNKYIKKDFFSIHIDYKWDQYDLNIEKFNSLLNKISLKTNIVISSGIEGSKFFEKLKKYYNFYSFKNMKINSINLINPNIILIDNLSINLLACFLNKCLAHVSSHSGATFHISAAFNKPLIDFIKKEKELEYDRWIPPRTDYYRVNVNKLDDLETIIFAKILY